MIDDGVGNEANKKNHCTPGAHMVVSDNSNYSVKCRPLATLPLRMVTLDAGTSESDPQTTSNGTGRRLFQMPLSVGTE